MSEDPDYLPGAEEAALEPETATVETAVAVVPKAASALVARDVGIAGYLSSAYQKAGTLRLTPEECKALKADFPDTAMITGAAGKENLIYIEAPHLRNRMDEVLGMGSWSHVSLRTWNEDYKTSKGYAAVRVYHECALIVRGVYITQAVGDMSYYPNNPEMNYGDAWQGSQSASLRRCLRDFGVGLQAWSKVFAAGWFERQRKGHQAPPAAAPAPAPAAALAPVAKPAPAKKEAAPKVATANTRQFVLDQLGCSEEGKDRNLLHSYLVALGWLDNEKVVEQWPARFVPITKEEIEALKICLGEFTLNGAAAVPYQPHGLDATKLQATNVTPVAAPSPEPAVAPALPAEPEWAKFPMPFGKSKGTPLGKFPTSELKFYMEQFKVRESIDVQNPDGTISTQALPPESIATQKLLRAALDEAAAHFEKQPKV
jgi:hypothetical protein